MWPPNNTINAPTRNAAMHPVDLGGQQTFVRYYNLGVHAHQQMGNLNSSIVLLSYAMNLPGTTPTEKAKALEYRSILYYYLGRYEFALRDLNYALYLSPQEASCYSSRAIYYYNMNLYSAALADIEQAIRLDPNCINYLVERAKIYVAINQPQAAILDFEYARKLNGELPDSHPYWEQLTKKQLESLGCHFKMC